MQICRDTDSIYEALRSTPDAELHQLMSAHIERLQECGYMDLGELVHFVVFEQGDRITDLDAALGFPIMTNRFDNCAVKLAGGATIPGQGLVETFARASICRDQSDHLHDAFKLVCLGVCGLLKAPPNGLVAKLTGSPQEPWLRHFRRLLWGFTRDKAKGLPSSALLAKSQWHPLLLERIRALVKTIHTEFGIETADNLGNKLAKKGLDETPLKASADIAAGNRPGMRVETVHQVKGESIDAVLYVAKKPQVESLLAGVGSEEGRIGYVAVTRARNLFLLGVPNSAIKDLRGPLLDAGFQELAKAK